MKPHTDLSLSFEFFPPKTPEGKETLAGTAAALIQASPHFFSVTFGAGGSTRQGTHETVKLLQQKTGIPIAPHLSCTGFSRNELIELIKIYQELEIDRLVVLRGDLPSERLQEGELRYASELVALIRETTQDHFHIEVAAYPECHPQAENTRQDVLNLKRKVDAGADSAITQYFFNADAYFYFLDYCAEFNLFIPIVPGIMPIYQFGRLMRFSAACGAEVPRWIQKRCESYENDPESLQQFGLEVVHDLCERLLEGGAPGLHFYTLNQAEPSLQLLKMLNFPERMMKTQTLFAVGER